MGIAGRALVLGAVTVAALGAPVVLLRRGLRSTAEAVAGLGIALTALDAYALHEVAFADTDGLGYTALAAAVLAGVWAAYGVGTGALVPPAAGAVAGPGPGQRGTRPPLRLPSRSPRRPRNCRCSCGRWPPAPVRSRSRPYCW